MPRTLPQFTPSPPVLATNRLAPMISLSGLK